MSAVAAVLAVAPLDSAVAMPAMPAVSSIQPAAADAAGQFGQLVTQGLDHVNSDLVASQVDMQRLATGDTGDLHRIMIHLEETQLSFQLMMQVRSRLLDAYSDVMKMQV
jgi:flagellar hook-basal body complex protein FliE